MAQKPLLFPTTPTDTEKFMESADYEYANRDPSYVPGWCEHLAANEVESSKMAEPAKRERYVALGREPAPLPVNFAWVRVTGPNGGTSYSADIETAEWRRRGYRPVTKAEMKLFADKYGYGEPPAARIAEDGTYHREDVQLFVVDGERAARHEAQRLRDAQMFENPSNKAVEHTNVPISVTEEKRRTFALASGAAALED